MSTIELLPCPFCGVRDEDLDIESEYGVGLVFIRCVCTAEGPLGDTIDEAVSLWNARSGEKR